MSNIKLKSGIQPEVRDEFYLRDSVLAGDIVFAVTPATSDQEPTTDAWSRDVAIVAKTSGGDVHDWLNITLACSIADTSTGGTAALATGDSTPSMVNGRASVTVDGSGAWIQDDTDTMTLADKTILGYTVTGGTSVQTTTT